MHCVSSYPCNLENINFPRLEKLKLMSKEIGYSGHYSGIYYCGNNARASYIEKYFTTDKEYLVETINLKNIAWRFLSISKFRDNYLKMSLDRGLDLQEWKKIFIIIIEEDGQNK